MTLGPLRLPAELLLDPHAIDVTATYRGYVARLIADLESQR